MLKRNCVDAIMEEIIKMKHVPFIQKADTKKKKQNSNKMFLMYFNEESIYFPTKPHPIYT